MQVSGNTTMLSCKKNSNMLCCCQKTFKRNLCTLAGKSFGSASLKGKSQFYTVKQPKLSLLRQQQKETWGEKKKEFVTVS